KPLVTVPHAADQRLLGKLDPKRVVDLHLPLPADALAAAEDRSQSSALLPHRVDGVDRPDAAVLVGLRVEQYTGHEVDIIHLTANEERVARDRQLNRQRPHQLRLPVRAADQAGHEVGRGTVVHDLGLIAVRGHHGGLEPDARARLTEPLDAVVELAQGRVMVPGLLLPSLVLVGTPDVDLGEQLRRSGQRRDSAALVSRTVRRDTTMLPRYSVPTSVGHCGLPTRSELSRRSPT